MLVCAEGLEMKPCAFCFATKRVASICVNKEQRKLTLVMGKYRRGKEGWAGFGYTATKKVMGFQLQLSCVFIFQYKSWKKEQMPNKKERDLLRIVPARPATWPVRTQFDFYVVGSVPGTLNNAVLSRMLHRVPARWGPESTQLEGKLQESHANK